MQSRPLGEETEGESTDTLVGTVHSLILKLGTHLEIASEVRNASALIIHDKNDQHLRLGYVLLTFIFIND